ncbi:MAG: thiamine pyrophosphate-dependent enzyme [Gemmatimonadota bacterium]|nr:thiamine pyrophosphate-dependent enzyme [Gemmatimonadota bacterium]
MTPDAGDAPESSSGLPRSAIPFAGTGRDSREPVHADDTADSILGNAELRDLFSAVAVSRAAASRLVALEDAGLVRGAPNRPAFREGGAVGVAHALRPASDGTGDIFAPTFRAAGALERYGLSLDGFFEEHLAGRAGPFREVGTELHHVDLQAGLLAPVVPLGLLVEVVGGMCLGFRMRGEARVGVVCDSDGATSTGAWHEGLVFAAARRCPMVLVVEAGREDEAAARRHSRLESFTEKARGYGLGSASVDGADLSEIVVAVRHAAERARRGDGVQLVEIRYTGVDPLERLRTRMVADEVASEDELATLEARAASRCAAALERVRNASLSGAHDTLPGVYAESERTDRRIWADPGSTQAV